MRKNFLIIFALLSFTFVQAQSDTLNNESIVKLHQSGFSSEVLKSKITNTPAKFDVSINALMKLKENKLPEDVINLMISNPNGSGRLAAAQPASNPGKVSNVNTGIYLIKSATETVEINPTYITSKKVDRTAQFLVSTIIAADVRVILTENHSALETSNMPKFQFVFDTLKNNNENPYFGRNSMPKNFFLVKLKSTKKTREL